MFAFMNEVTSRENARTHPSFLAPGRSGAHPLRPAGASEIGPFARTEERSAPHRKLAIPGR